MRQAVTRDGSHHRELVTVAATCEPYLSSPAVPPTCPTHRCAAVIHGQQWSVRVLAEL
jgi:hypothetical protein